MFALGLDTSQRWLAAALMEDDTLLEAVQLDCPKQQSERLMPVVDELLRRRGLEAGDIGRWVITIGPGSYTGVRIAMTLAKVAGSLMEKEVYTLSSLQLIAGDQDCWAITDARAGRVYAGRYRGGTPLQDDAIYPLAQMREQAADLPVKGDGHLLGRADDYGDLGANFLTLKPHWRKVERIDTLTPSYLKSSEAYRR
jgi:tRNA threonylcarbamoyladenosine biosynthesis protein TsaB